MAGEPTSDELAWRRYSLYVSLYQFYLNGLVQFNALQYAITGGLLAYVLAHPEVPKLRFALALPALFALGQVVVIAAGFRPLSRLRGDLRDAAGELRLSGGSVAVRPLQLMMWVFLAVNAATVLALVWVAWDKSFADGAIK